jgi:hypothetical protein
LEPQPLPLKAAILGLAARIVTPSVKTARVLLMNGLMDDLLRVKSASED